MFRYLQFHSSLIIKTRRMQLRKVREALNLEAIST